VSGAMVGTGALNAQGVVVWNAYVAAAEALARAGVPVRTGAAEGADQVAAEVTLHAGGSVQLVLPWRDYNSRWVDRMQGLYAGRVSVEVYDPALHARWWDSVTRYHPAGQRLSPAARKLHARNYGIVEPVAGVIAVPRMSDAHVLGGTAQAMRIAKALGKPLFNLQIPAERDAAAVWISQL
jgi:hypothetical protein